MTTAAELPATTDRAPRGTLARRCLMRLHLYFSKRRERQVLSGLTDDQLRDIGLTPSEARVEVEKSWFWG